MCCVACNNICSADDFSVDTGKRKFIFTAETHEEATEWLCLISQALDGEHNPDHIKPVFEDGVWVVRGSLKEEELAKLEEMHSIVNQMELDETTKNWCDDACLCRFLR